MASSTLSVRLALLCCCLSALLALVAGQDIRRDEQVDELFVRAETMPECAATCVADLAPQYGCSPTDSDCTCTNANLTAAATACVGANCSVREALTAQRLTSNTCGDPVRDRGPQSRTIMWSLYAISITFVALRFVARSKKFDGPGFGADDWTMLVVMAFMVPHEVGLELMVRNGLGQDIWMIQPFSNLEKLLMFFWQGEMWYTFVVMGTKISILLLYTRIFPKTVSSAWFRNAVYALIGTCTAATIAFVLSIIFQCDPVPGAYKAWDGEYSAQCFNTNAQIIAMAGINILLDLTVFLLPLPKLVQLEISTRKKIGVCLTFMTGLFVTIVSIIRLVKFIQHYDTANTTWDFVPIGTWSQFEVNVGIWCACMPALARLIKKLWVDVLGRKLSTYLGGRSGPTHDSTQRSTATIGSAGLGKKGWASKARSRLGSGSEVELSDDVEAMPRGGVAKTVEAKVVYNRRIDSTDELESMAEDKESTHSASAMYHQHRYVRDW